VKSIVFCSSQRFAKELQEFIDNLHALAKEKRVRVTVLQPEFSTDSYDLGHLPEKDRLKHPVYKAEIAGKVYDHLFRKVRVADICFVFNKHGYMGPNVVGEIFAAAALGKMVYSFDGRTLMGSYPRDLYEEPSVKKLIHNVISTPEDLLDHLM
jgi:hypothetical protein